MSDSSKRGVLLEREVSAILRKKLGARVMRDSRSGAGVNKQDIRDYYNDIPFSIECKDQETIKVKEWMRQAIDAASFTQVPTLVFRADEEILACVRFSDLVNLAVEIADQKAEIDDLRMPSDTLARLGAQEIVKSINKQVVKLLPHSEVLKQAAARKIERGVKTDANGHITDDYGYCNQKGCKFSRGYKPPKAKKS